MAGDTLLVGQAARLLGVDAPALAAFLYRHPLGRQCPVASGRRAIPRKLLQEIGRAMVAGKRKRNNQ